MLLVTRELSSARNVESWGGWLSSEFDRSEGVPPRPYIFNRGALHADMIIVNQLSLSSYSSADPSSLGSVVRGSSVGRSGHCCDYLLEVIGPSGLAPIRPYVNLLHWSFLPRPTKGWPYDLLGPLAFREVFYPSSGPGGYLSPTNSSTGA
jgi:hypothetical protein